LISKAAVSGQELIVAASPIVPGDLREEWWHQSPTGCFTVALRGEHGDYALPGHASCLREARTQGLRRTRIRLATR
jgi:hypothetical protein